jgi:hypothetical protein
MGRKGTGFSISRPNQETHYLMSLSPEFLTKVDSLFLNILNSICMRLLWFSILLESSWNFTSCGGSFVQFRVVLVKQWAFQGMSSFCRWFLLNIVCQRRLIWLWDREYNNLFLTVMQSAWLSATFLWTTH